MVIFKILKKQMKEFLFKYFPRSITKILRRIYYFPKDLFGQTNGELLPPRGKIDIGSGDFKAIGEEFVNLFIKFCNLKSDASVLDVGCGIGRMAIPLTKFLNQYGKYEGFDIVEKDIIWCRRNITLKFPNFNFHTADIYNQDYNPKGKFRGSEYGFPYNDNAFDFVFLTSVFTHMLPLDVDNYLKEIKRVLKEGGICFITYFLLNEESLELIKNKKSLIDFKFAFEFYRTDHRKINIAFDEDFILNLYSKHGLNIIEPIRYGSFCGREKYLSYQDIIIAVK